MKAVVKNSWLLITHLQTTPLKSYRKQAVIRCQLLPTSAVTELDLFFDPKPSGLPPTSIIICKVPLYQTLVLLATIRPKGQKIRQYCDKLTAVGNKNTSNKENTSFVQKFPFSQNRTQK